MSRTARQRVPASPFVVSLTARHHIRRPIAIAHRAFRADSVPSGHGFSRADTPRSPGRPTFYPSRLALPSALLFPQLLPIPDPGHHFVRQSESELMREHTHLPAMVRFVRNHVAQHFHANRPRCSPAVSAKCRDAPATAERFSEHLPAASAALRQSRTSLLRRAARAVEPSRNLHVRSRKPHPLAANI